MADEVHAVKGMNLVIGIATVRDDGERREVIPEEELADIEKKMNKEMEELGFDELIVGLLRGLLEEHFLPHHPSVEIQN